MDKEKRNKVLIAGIAGASLGTELAKCLLLSEKYEVYGCDISPLAFGHFSNLFKKTITIDKENYVNDIITACLKHDIKFIIPGGEETMVQLSDARDKLSENEIRFIGNSQHVINVFSNKKKTFEFLKKLEIEIPLTQEVNTVTDLDKFNYPCIIKPATGSGGSKLVFIARNKQDCITYLHLVGFNKRKIIVQEYLPLDEGEFTVGVLSLSNGEIASCVSMKRIFNSKLSIAYQSESGLISSGYSQGLILNFSNILEQATRIAKAINSTGPINIQGRMRNGILIPFEINPRFSSTVYLRALAGVNEVDFFFRHLIDGENKFNYLIKEGYYLRSFTEQFVSVKDHRYVDK